MHLENDREPELAFYFVPLTKAGGATAHFKHALNHRGSGRDIKPQYIYLHARAVLSERLEN